jgi:hypothetical protein
MESQKHRPLGVTLVAILTAIGGLIFLGSGLGLGLLIIGFGFLLLVLGIAFLVMAYGLWNGRGWAWTITLILSAIGIIVAIATTPTTGYVSAIISIIIHAVVIYYLYRPNVKAFFGK